ncbi:hypothetical protein HMPREF0580_0932 [Mobiluncus mulieris ATCC 35239]|uniref:Uncharacterized protein n=1 Tax=Mobiluncus mulieris ATCC 35239 TaxID=871571 RepID=E0QQ05_9ACTO|nr:hypothetical protein HMPREF0577_0284 [Mobiluncus mulieris ATCC 35243]EFM46385.1 hypothetical protein HMPREF0580_0932 [Mobiluncus mulieris ATCC 35239]
MKKLRFARKIPRKPKESGVSRHGADTGVRLKSEKCRYCRV